MKTPSQLLRSSFPNAIVLLLLFTITASFSALGQVPRIDSVSPNSAPIGTPITISGANFSPTPADNIVFFGAVKATVTSAQTTAATLISTGSIWRYLDDGSNQGAAWQAILFDDSTWRAGAAQLGYGDGDETTVVSYGSDPNFKYVTTYFRQAFMIDDPASYSALTVRLLRDDGGVVYLNGVEVFRSNMPAGFVNYQTLAAASIPNADESRFFPAVIDPSLLVRGVNVVAVEIHQASFTSADISFDLDLVATVASASANSLTAIVPTGATYAPVTVTVGGLTAYANAPFVVTFNGGDITTSSFAPRVEFPAEVGRTLAVAIADLDGDGKPDLVVADDPNGSGAAPGVSVYRNVSAGGSITAGAFAAKISFPSPSGSLGGPVSLAIGDMDGDGKLDIVAVSSADGTIYVFRNQSTSGTIALNSFAPAALIYTRGASLFTLALADLDGDGRLDIVSAAGELVVLRNICVPGTIDASSFAPPVFTQENNGCYISALVTADLDGDGKSDVAAASEAGCKAVYIFRNTSTVGGINFQSRKELSVTGGPRSIAAGDLNGDGKPEILVGMQIGFGFGPNNVAIFQNNAAAGSLDASSFAPGVEFFADGFVTVALADINGDGRVDIVGPDGALGNGQRVLSVLENRTPAGAIITASSFAPSATFFTSAQNNGAGCIAIGDLDGDGLPDLVTGHVMGGVISVFRNTVAPPLTITCPANIVAGTAVGLCSAVVSFAATASGGSGSATVTCSPPSGSVFPKGTTPINCTAIDGSGNTANCYFAVAVNDTEKPHITCPANIAIGCSVNLLVPVTFAATATDNCDPSPTVTCSPASGSGFPIGTTTVTCTATDASGNSSLPCSFTVTRAALGFTGFLAPIGGADATGGSFANPLKTFKMKTTIPVSFTANCGGAAVLTGVHQLQVIKYSDATTAGDPIDATPQGSATTGDQFQLANNEWKFHLDTKATGMSIGIWLLRATLSDGSQHTAWIQIK